MIDCFLYEGQKVLYRVSLAIVQQFSKCKLSIYYNNTFKKSVLCLLMFCLLCFLFLFLCLFSMASNKDIEFIEDCEYLNELFLDGNKI